MRPHTKPISFALLVLGILLLPACAFLEFGLETTAPTAVPVLTLTPIVNGAEPTVPAPTPVPPTAVPQPATPISDPATDGLWREVWETQGNFGFAVPCWWTVYPAPPEGLYGATTIASYDEAYFLEHSLKGQWIGGEAPEGAMKMDLIVFPIADASLSLEEAARQALTSDEQTVEFADQRTLGRHEAVLLHLRSTVNPDSSGSVYVIRLAPDKFLLAGGVAPESALVSRDAQGILESIAIDQQEGILKPAFAPHDPLNGDPPAPCGSADGA